MKYRAANRSCFHVRTITEMQLSSEAYPYAITSLVTNDIPWPLWGVWVLWQLKKPHLVTTSGFRFSSSLWANCSAMRHIVGLWLAFHSMSQLTHICPVSNQAVRAELSHPLTVVTKKEWTHHDSIRPTSVQPDQQNRLRYTHVGN